MLNYKDVANAFDFENTAQQMLSGSLDELNACFDVVTDM